MRKLIILLMVMLIFVLVSGIAAAKEISVNSTDSIQTAVNNAASGDVIIVKPGTYNENIKVTTQSLVIRSESGKPENTIIKAVPNTSVFNVAAINTTISGFRIESGETGIYLVRCSGCTIINNELSDNKHGISLSSSNNNNISENQVNSNKMYGIQLVNSEGNKLLNNNVNLNERGINHINSNKSTISGNNVSNNVEFGMWISYSNDNEISGNTANETSRGIFLDSSGDNTVSGNIVAFNNVSGFYECPACHRNLVFNNYVNNVLNADINTRDTTWNIEMTSGRNIVGGKYIGGNFWAKPDGTGFSQTATDANGDGIADSSYIDSKNYVIDYLPLVPVSNPQQPVLPVANFSTSVTSGYAPLTVQFTDLSENAVSRSWDINNDGTVDNTSKSFVYVYQEPGNYTAKLTVSNENGTDSKTRDIIVTKFIIYPVADFSTNVTSGYSPLSVLFTDKSQNATSRNWDIGNDGTVESTNASFVYVFTNPGTYPVSLTAINENGTSPAKTATITVTTEESSSSGGSSHHSSGGGGGAGGSPEPQTNVQVKELSQARVTNGKPVLFDFTKNATCVAYVSFDAKKTAGKITTIAEQLKAKSTLVSVLDSGEVYKYFNLWVGNSGFATEKNIENPVVCFKVEKSWLQDKKIDQSSITLNRYNDKKWSQLPVKLLKEDSKYLYFTAETPGFSFFAITGKAVEKVAEAKPSTDTSKLDQNSTASETETEQKTEQEEGKNKTTSIPGFEALYVVACLVMVFLHRRK
ncbi:Cell surface protein [Methanosarcina sp. Kolksee]|uniref:PGF-pre-PGF domain-containing protein n=1 Tax=Methanosarcina sp. Kolksee TaxID=1434099 RepID=UPI000615776C|nr:PGF-pre-PGF domain-containing protein [Methanosarcina sp. Kolksee]AKB47033.1 Cell surface protein [Methanosarcina sp. Kolksee]